MSDHPSQPPTIKRKHDSIMRPPLGRKRMPWRVTDNTPSRSAGESYVTAYDWTGIGTPSAYGILRVNPTVILMYDPSADRWHVLRAGRLVADYGTRSAAAMRGLQP